jgi:hypothetical protein
MAESIVPDSNIARNGRSVMGFLKSPFPTILKLRSIMRTPVWRDDHPCRRYSAESEISLSSAKAGAQMRGRISALGSAQNCQTPRTSHEMSFA